MSGRIIPPVAAVDTRAWLEAAELLEDLGDDLLGGDLLQVVWALDRDVPGVRGDLQPMTLILLAPGSVWVALITRTGKSPIGVVSVSSSLQERFRPAHRSTVGEHLVCHP